MRDLVAVLMFVLFALLAIRYAVHAPRSRKPRSGIPAARRDRVTYKPGKCNLCWGSKVLEWLHEPPNGRGLHACTRCGGSGRGAGTFLRA